MKLDLAGTVMTGTRYNEVVDWLIGHGGAVAVMGKNYKGNLVAASRESLESTRVAPESEQFTVKLEESILYGPDELLVEFKLRFA